MSKTICHAGRLSMYEAGDLLHLDSHHNLCVAEKCCERLDIAGACCACALSLVGYPGRVVMIHFAA